MSAITERGKVTKERLDALRARLESSLPLIAERACVYATGSFGRFEAGVHSDLDLFILARTDEAKEEKESLLQRLDEICLKADLIRATRALHIPDFDGDGKYLVQYTVHELTKTLGTSKDDVSNTFTARLLLLLESTPLLEEDVYLTAMTAVIAAYWRDFDDHSNDFAPAFIANDILRLWRTFCVNYEARTVREPAKDKIKGKIKNYKLKHSRMLTCYSALIFLLHLFNKYGSVSPEMALTMARMSPISRIESLANKYSELHQLFQNITSKYNEFLEVSNASEDELILKFGDPEYTRQRRESAEQFGQLIFEALSAVGNGSKFYRMLVV